MVKSRAQSVLFVTTGTLSLNASIQRAVFLVRGLKKTDVGAVLMLQKTDENHRFAVEHGVLEFVHWVDGRHLRHYWRSRQLAEDCDLVHLIAPTLAGICLAGVARARGRLVISDWDELYIAQPDRRLGRLRRSLLQAITTLFTDGYVFASQSLIAWYRNWGGRKPCSYIPYGLWTERKRASRSDPVNLGDWAFYVGGFHRVFREDLDQLVEFGRIAARWNLGLMLVGQGGELENIVSRLQHHLPPDRLRVLGQLSPGAVDTLLLEETIRICFLPLKDTAHNRCRCPNKMFHYILAGKPIMTNNVGEAVAMLGDQAEYYIYNDAKSMEQAFERALKRRPCYNLEIMDWQCRARAYEQSIERAQGLLNRRNYEI